MANNDANVCLIVGNFKDRSAVISKIKKHLGNYELSVFDENALYEQVEHEILTPPVFNDHRLFVIKDWPNTTSTKPTMQKHFLKAIASVPKTNVVILDNLSVKGGVFEKGINDIGKVFKFDQRMPLDKAASSLVGWLKEAEKDLDINLASSAAGTINIIDNNQGVDVDELYMMSKRIIEYTGSRKIIKPEDIRCVCQPSKEVIIWRLYDAMDKKDFPTCLKMAQYIYEQSSNVESEIVRTLHAMIWRYKLLLFLREATENGLTRQDIISKTTSLVKLKREGMGTGITMFPELTTEKQEKHIYSEKYVDMILRDSYGRPSVIKTYGRKELYMILEGISSSLETIRSGCVESHKKWLFESILMIGCCISTPRMLNQMRICVNANLL